MTSRLTVERPDLWQRGLDLATGLTGYLYLPKLPLPDGTIFACGYGNWPAPTIDEKIRNKEDYIEQLRRGGWTEAELKDRLAELDELKKLRGDSVCSAVLVPDGAMEWLLHEVGHWIAASPEERQLPNYGNGHEIEAWAFEEIVLGQFGPARHFAPLTQRDGTAFDLSGPIPAWAFRHIDRQIAADRIAVEQFKLLWAEWVQWGIAKGEQAPWKSAQ